MALNLKNPEVENLAEDVAALAGETKTEAIRRALLERKERLALGAAEASRSSRGQDFVRWLAEEIWPQAPPGELGRRSSRDEEEALLGFGPEGA